MNFRHAAALTATMLIPSLGEAQDGSPLKNFWPKEQTGTITRTVKYGQGGKNEVELLIATEKLGTGSYRQESASDLKADTVSAIIDGKKEKALTAAGQYDALAKAGRNPEGYWFDSPFVASEAVEDKLVSEESVAKQYHDPKWREKVLAYRHDILADRSGMLSIGQIRADEMMEQIIENEMQAGRDELMGKLLNDQPLDVAAVKRYDEFNRVLSLADATTKSGGTMVGFVKQQFGKPVLKPQPQQQPRP